MKRAFRWYDYVSTNIYFLGLSTMSQTLSPLVYPLLVQQFVGEDAKGTFFGTLRLWSLMVALLAQAFWGILSDRTRLRWGRRRPYIFGGTIVDLVFIALIGFSFGLSGWTGFWFLFAVAILLQISSNAAQAAQQAVIPDLVPDDQRGRFSAIKAVFEVPLPVILVAFTVGKMVAAGNVAGALLVAACALVASMFLAMFIPEAPLSENLPALDWQPFVRLLLMTGVFTIIIIGLGQVTNLVGSLLTSIDDVTTLLMVWGVIGLIAMIVAVALGVYSSIQLSLGAAAKLNPSFAWWVINRLAFLVGAVNISTFVVFYLQGRLGLVR
jgi:Na+/melibiose symporter-like transporter